MKTFGVYLLAALVRQALALPASEIRTPTPTADHARAGAVRAAYKTAWAGYYKYAWPHDELLPISNTYVDDRAQWGLTPIDGLDTAIVMNDKDIVNTILDFIPTVDFTTTRKVGETISLFETTIRYIGGLLSAYDLLKGPYKRLANDPKKVDALLTQAASLADTLSIAFDTPSGIADGYLVLNPSRKISGAASSNLAEVGTLILEWTRLSDLTGNPKYAQLAAKCEAHLLAPKGSPEAWPGLVGTDISTTNGTFLNSAGGWSGGADSFYEYLIKMYVYDPKSYGQYRDRWVAAADSTMEHLASNPTSRKDLTFLKQFNGQNTEPVTGHLTSFAGGNFILAGTVLKEDKYTQFGLALAESYFATYTATASGIGPETFRWVDTAANTSTQQPPADQASFYAKAGFWVDGGAYILRPETMESLYYAYRATGDKKYQDLAWSGFSAIAKRCRVGSGFSGLRDVRREDGGGFDDLQQSFFLAETLKYAYLIFADDTPVQVKGDGANQFVFNTEAHPFKVRG
ncbi:mannosidase MsdS [Cordyceps fumosorosea ARSEF 2679]|uniref:alpha-1,2-Mannosidase n=1 Tax=Cordyceps fumosorosea (strain ARSEF 2679) TaxID=1081104 RepID=A0A167N4E2_CORFA|nr:mannosidase MsdS [Cordyceps fumosorosea ARSEF 2679]OAA55117.1 mannosidase MsdS [Cordyceps fumosorosea ARSEF 2679]